MQNINSITLLSSEPSAYSDCACSFSEEVGEKPTTKVDTITLLENEPSAYGDCACSFSEEINQNEKTK